MERIDLKFTARDIVKVTARLIGGATPVGLEISVQGADPDAILSQMFEWFGKEEIIKFLDDEPSEARRMRGEP